MTAVLETFLDELTSNPGVAALFCGVCLAVAWRWLFLSRIRIVQKDKQQNAEIAADVARAHMQTVVKLSSYRDKKGVA